MAGDIGARIRELRLRAGMTQEELAFMLCETCAKQHVSSWERGRRNPGERRINDLARVFAVSPGYIRYGEGINND